MTLYDIIITNVIKLIGKNLGQYDRPIVLGSEPDWLFIVQIK